MCVKIIRIFVHISKIDDNLVKKLVQIGTNSNCDESIKCEIFDLFKAYDKNENFLLTGREFYLRKIQLANLAYKSNHELLEKLNAYVDLDDGFLHKNYKQLQNIIDGEININLQAKALNLLSESKAKDKICDELLESVALLYESTVSENIHKACLNLLNKVNQSGKRLGQRANFILYHQLEREENLQKIYQSPVYDDLKNEFNLDDSMIKILFDAVKFKNTELKVENLEAFMENIIKENRFFYDNPIFVLIIEKCLSMYKLTEIALPCYRQIIKNNKGQIVKNTLETLSLRSLDNEISLDLLNAIFAAIQANIHLADVCVQVLEKSLNDSEGIERSVSFKTLYMIKKQSFYSDTLLKSFDLWCNQSFKTLSQQCWVNIQDMNILEIVLSIKYICLDIFRKKPKKIWQRELLVSNLFEIFKANMSERMDFYSNWLIVEKKFNIPESIKILTLLQPNLFDSFNQINESISIILELESYQKIINLLNEDNLSIYSSIKQEWCEKNIKKYLRNQCIYVNKIYLSWLVENLSYKLDLIDFCATEKLKSVDLDFEKVNLKDLRLLLEVKCLKKSIKAGDQGSFLTNILMSLLNKDWTSEKLNMLLNSTLKSNHIIDFLNTLDQYNLSSFSNFHKCKQILCTSKTSIESIRKLNTLAIENNFQLEGKVKDTSELLIELKSGLNLTNKNLIKYVETDLRTHLELLKSETLKSEICTQTVHPIAHWNEKQISQWSKQKSKMKNVKSYEAIAVIKQANLIQTGHTLTDTQILCSLIALNNGDQELKSKLLEVVTGEGKSTIICILAIINALKGFKVDVITSSPVLAERDAKQKAKLYKMFNLTCSDNNDKTLYLKGPKDCYKADIVYGEVSQFEFDILRDNYSKLDTLDCRKCEIAIIDEVDTLLIDDSSKIARLSSTVPGMDHFYAIFVFIWQRLLSIKQKFFTFNNRTYFVEGKIEFENEKIILQYVDSDNDNTLKKVENLELFLLNCNNNQLDSIGVECVGDDIEDYLKLSLERFVDIQVKELDVMIPQNLEGYFRRQKPKWISNAIESLNYQENVHYVVQDGKIKPVDYYSTGIVQSMTNWSDGLHQFLQIKHNLKMVMIKS
ncbi:pre translocase subunit [Brachionus plicatilis]|uniref:Pre translocase subunit n=1 Tax=Brachionus plicatilis TaxID=10195 RepID=A0A3M7PWX3_BRAPC|nr:pre translocase subunit [Brachionus plicatilis]